MRRLYLGLLLLPSICLLRDSALAQSLDLKTVVTKAHHAFSGGQPIQSLQMSGAAIWYGNGSAEQGSVTLSVNRNGSNKMMLTLSDGSRTEEQQPLAEGRGCTWSGSDGIAHTSASSNCFTAIPWFAPEIAVQLTGEPDVLGVNYLGLKTHGSKRQHRLEHQAIIGSALTGMDVTKLIQQWSTTDLDIDPATFLPATLAYTAHADDDSGITLDQTVTYDDYHTQSGVTLPYHIQRYLNGTLQLDITLQQVSAQ